MAKKDFGDELFYYFNKWKQDKNHPYIPKFIDKLITVNLQKQGRKKIADFNSEEFQEHLHLLRVKCYLTLNKITEPTSKRIYNYLDCTVRYGLMDLRKELANKIDRKPLTQSLDSTKVLNMGITLDDSLSYLTGVQKEVAYYLINKYSIKDIQEETGLSKKEFLVVKKELARMLKND